MTFSDNRYGVLILLLISALVGILPPAHAGPQDNILRFGLHVSSMGNLDPHFAAGSQDRAFADMVFNGLLRYVPGNAPKIEPDLAARMPELRMEHGRQVWTITLRKGVRFHAGPKTPAYELTVDDVIYSLNKSADKAFCAYSGNYAGFILKKIDAYTLEIILETPISSVLFFRNSPITAADSSSAKRPWRPWGMKGIRPILSARDPLNFPPMSRKNRLP